MKRLFSKQKPPSPLSSFASSPVVPPLATTPTTDTTGLQPKYVVPPIPHPRPHDHIALLATSYGLLIRPCLDRGTRPEHHLRIGWGKSVKVEELDGDGEGPGVDWSETGVVYGFIGILELFAASYLLVITSRSDVGSLFNSSRTIYAVKNVAAIPLVEDRARSIISALALKNAALARASLIVTPSEDVADLPGETSIDGSGTTSPEPRVKFSDDAQVKVLTPSPGQTFEIPDRPASPTSFTSVASGASTPTSEYSDSPLPIAKALAERLSFWSRSSRRLSVPISNFDDPAMPSSTTAFPASNQPSESILKEEGGEPEEVLNNLLTETAPSPATLAEKHSELEEKILRQTIKNFSKGEMYFAYDFDITRSLQHKQDRICRSQKQHNLLAELTAQEAPADSNVVCDSVDVFAEPMPTLPLWRRVDRQFWWNEFLSRLFIDAGLHSYVLPIVQGYFQVASFSVPREPEVTESGDAAIVDYVILSRRSRDRAGLRYQRRGVDDDARVANFVETETIMRVEREGASNVFSYVQIRGSIPLFWTQTGYGLKPAPQLSTLQTPEQNAEALRRHFNRTIPVYGPHTIVNLAEQHGKEGAVTNAYCDYVGKANLPDVKYCQYDFHAETKGMKYENISKLIADLERAFEAQGYLWVSDERVLSRQKGVYRVNCIDCLDRTNVVQSAFARYVLNRQLLAVALFNPSEQGRTDLEVVFNDVWANNGDAISRSYAGTSALKGDFTRTGKRDLGGLLNDGMNSLARMYASTFSDWFCQAVIDYMLGYRTLSVFSEFLNKLQSTDPRELIRLSKIRAEAIATSVSRLLQDGEGLLSGWTLFAPAELNTKTGDKIEEKVLLLSRKALYIVSYDYNLEKVKMYTRVPLGDVVGITHGAYILSPLEEASRDPVQNAGFTIRWLTANATTRVTSYSVRNSLDVPEPFPPTPPSSLGSPLNPGTTKKAVGTNATTVEIPAAPAKAATPARKSLVLAPTRLSRLLSSTAPPMTTETSFAAFKALPIDPARTRRGSTFTEPADELAGASTCKEAVELMVDAIRAACEDAGAGGPGFVKAEDVVSLAEAQKMTSVYAKMEYGVKRLLWLGG